MPPARDQPAAAPPPASCQSCLGLLYAKSEYGSKGPARPVCVGVTSPAEPDPTYDRREALVRSFAGDYKIICLGSALYDTPAGTNNSRTAAAAADPGGLPRCVGVEILVAAAKERGQLPAAATTPSGARAAAASSSPPPPPPPRYRPPPQATGSKAPGSSSGSDADSPAVFRPWFEAAGIGGGDDNSPLGRFARRFAATADRNLGRMRDALDRAADVLGVGGGGGTDADAKARRRSPPKPPPSSSSPSPPPPSSAAQGGGGGGGGNSSSSGS